MNPRLNFTLQRNRLLWNNRTEHTFRNRPVFSLHEAVRCDVSERLQSHSCFTPTHRNIMLSSTVTFKIRYKIKDH